MTPLLETKGLTKVYARPGGSREAVHQVSFRLDPGEALAVVGGSGCGKSTLARLVTRLTDPTAGEILLNGRPITHLRGGALRQVRRQVQMVFQTPAASFDPRQTLADVVAEPLRNAGLARRQANARALALLAECGLDPALGSRRAAEVSGGQCQRAAIARALAIGPRLLVCDEITSALDVTVQQQILALLAKLRAECGLSFLFISHDLALVQQFCDRVLVMQDGRLVEEGPVTQVLTRPRHPATRALIDAAL